MPETWKSKNKWLWNKAGSTLALPYVSTIICLHSNYMDCHSHLWTIQPMTPLHLSPTEMSKADPAAPQSPNPKTKHADLSSIRRWKSMWGSRQRGRNGSCSLTQRSRRSLQRSRKCRKDKAWASYHLPVSHSWAGSNHTSRESIQSMTVSVQSASQRKSWADLIRRDRDQFLDQEHIETTKGRSRTCSQWAARNRVIQRQRKQPTAKYMAARKLARTRRHSWFLRRKKTSILKDVRQSFWISRTKEKVHGDK